jgi:hypothetical protein
MSREITIRRQDLVPLEDRKRVRIGSEKLERASEELKRLREKRDKALRARQVAVPSRCSIQKDGNYFVVLQEIEGGRWAVVNVSIALPAGPVADQSALVAASGLDWSGYTACPYCGSRAVFKCCGRLACQGSAYQDSGRTWVRCPWCGTTSYLSGSFDSINGEQTGGKGAKSK